MTNLKEAADEKLHKTEVEVNGIKVVVDKRCLNSFDLLMAMGRMQNGDISATDEVLTILFGDQKEAVLTALRGEDGFLAYSDVASFAGEVMKEAGSKN